MKKAIVGAVKKVLGRKPAAPWVDRWHLESAADCMSFLSRHVPEVAAAGNGGILVIGEESAERGQLSAAMRAKGVNVEVRLPSGGDFEDIKNIACVTTSHFDARSVESIARALLATERLRSVPFEYILSRANLEPFERHDRAWYQGFYFIGPLLADGIDYKGIYEESLQHFELKCDVRDYLDLCQIIREIELNKIPGDVAEFGSYKGHSGYLISRLLEAHGSNKTLYMFDMFEAFPPEGLGVDSFWNDTHPVDFAVVSAKFAGRGNVRLVRGEFETTVPRNLPAKLAFAFIDCDSYRATKFLVNALFDPVLSSGGVMAFEDYGHPALLGNRLAVDELFAARPHCYRHFSQFSGIYIVRKN
jgi:hypothetical protein